MTSDTSQLLDDFRDRAAQWLDANAPELGSADDFTTAGERSPDHHFELCLAWQRKLYAGGWAGITWPTAVGGQGLSILHQIMFDDEQLNHGVSTLPLQIGQQLAGPLIIHFGTPDQQDRFLRPTLSGDVVWCELWSEPGAGSDLAAVDSYARPADGGWVLNGQKVWTSYAHYADRGLLIARTDRSVAKHAGLSFFLLDMTAPGVSVRPLRQMNGDSEFNEVFFDEVFVPEEDLLGQVGGGWNVVRTALANERTAVSPSTFGRNGTRFEGLARMVKDLDGADAFGRRDQLVTIYIRELVLGLLHDRVRGTLFTGNTASQHALASISKLAYAQYLKAIGELALEMQGARGLLTGSDAYSNGVWQDHFLWAPALRIGGGSDEIQRNTLAEGVLGLPRER
ncbi:acyl-CoA dehydrogenase family protein [Mycolicibacterium sp.]|uniref:acyl-CoA dehydrogenase family protein n=1 Tax=Mycolicibacterium sp. TaxID=2320850 RepID=UPI003D149C3E